MPVTVEYALDANALLLSKGEEEYVPYLLMAFP
jgi:hypothetical protein